MGTIHSLYNRIKAMDTDKIVHDSLNETKDTISDLNAEQMAKGLRSDGEQIAPFYKPLTIRLKQEFGTGIGSITDHVTLYNEGNFYKGIKTDIAGEKIITDSTDPKSAKIKKKYGEKVFGLNERSNQEYKERLQPVFLSKIEAATGLKMKK